MRDGFEQEQWRPVVGYERIYEVSNLGVVRSIARTCPTGRGATRGVPARTLTPNLDGNDYNAVRLSKDGRGKTVRVCRIVAAAFLGTRPTEMVIAHGPRGKHCDELSNLSYKTQAGNIADKLRDDTHTRGERHPKCLLTERQVLFARSVVGRRQVSCATLARAWGVSRSTVSKAANGINWYWLEVQVDA